MSSWFLSVFIIFERTIRTVFLFNIHMYILHCDDKQAWCEHRKSSLQPKAHSSLENHPVHLLMPIVTRLCSYNKCSPPKWPSTSLLTFFILFDKLETSTSGAESSKRTKHVESSQHNNYIWNYLRFKCIFYENISAHYTATPL